MLEVKKLFSGYGTIPILRDIEFSVQKGEILLIVGENGAGKSTLLRTVAGLIKPTEGTVELNGINIAGAEPDKIVGRGLRLVLDGHQVFPEISVYDNLRLGAAARKSSKAEFDRDVAEMLAVFPILEQKLRARARDLSGGQQQMLALAQAFVVKPSVLLCDEPSTGLAITLMPPIIDFLKKWAASGTAIVVVEQHLEIALGMAARVMLLERGAIRFSGTAPEFRQYIAAPAKKPPGAAKEASGAA